VLEEGAQVTLEAGLTAPYPMVGHVTSSYFSPILNRSIALAVIKGGRAKMGETVFIPMPGRDIAATVVDPVFYDRQGVKING